MKKDSGKFKWTKASVEKPEFKPNQTRSRSVLISNGEVVSVGNLHRKGYLNVWEKPYTDMDVKFWAEIPKFEDGEYDYA